jgi:signal transduction histidine kinase
MTSSSHVVDSIFPATPSARPSTGGCLMNPRTELNVSLRGAELDAAFPFHLVLDPEQRIRSAGSVIAKILPSVLESPRLTDCFDVLEPESALQAGALRAKARERVVLRSRAAPALVLRGQMLASSESRLVLFAGAPRLSVDEMKALGLELSDFAPHDGTTDFLALVEETKRDREQAVHDLALAKERLERELGERARMEDELRLAQRLEAVGQLAAGVAHEINTPIQYVGDSVHFLKDAFGDIMQLVASLREVAPPGVGDEKWEEADAEFLVEQVPKALERMFYGVDRVASIVRAMKAFAHPGTDTKEPSNINEALQTTLTVSRNEYKYVADVETEFADLPLVPCNLGELNQVFLNLVVNAAHAIAAANEGTETRGTIRVKTRIEEPFVVIEISDSGTGIPEEIRARIFDPFFTTKPVGKGTGQGLPIARNIVVKHNGTLTFDSEMGKGTVFTIRLPLSSEE